MDHLKSFFHELVAQGSSLNDIALDRTLSALGQKHGVYLVKISVNANVIYARYDEYTQDDFVVNVTAAMNAA